MMAFFLLTNKVLRLKDIVASHSKTLVLKNSQN
jgi:hypothetical protein